MKRLLAILALLPALVSAQPASLEAVWTSPRTAQVAWTGPGGPGVCVHRERAYNLHKIYAEECGRPSGVIALGVDAEVGDRFMLVAFDGVTVLAEAELGQHEQRLVLVVAPQT